MQHLCKKMQSAFFISETLTMGGEMIENMAIRMKEELA